MLAIEVSFLTGRYVATAYNDRERAEWPPHPARFYSALVAAWAEDKLPAEGLALEWLASQPPPNIFASTAFERISVPVYVPVNDQQTVAEPDKARRELASALADFARARDAKGQARAEKGIMKAEARLIRDTAAATEPTTAPSKEDLKRAQWVLPDGRARQPRFFPSVTPVDPVISFAWSGSPAPEVRDAIASLCAKVTRLGHSSSLVNARLVDRVEGDPMVPDLFGNQLIRLPREDQLTALMDAYEDHRGFGPRVLPCTFVRYRSGALPSALGTPSTHFSADWLLFERVGEARFPGTAGPPLAKAFRAALLQFGEDPLPAVLSGHEPDGSPALRVHMAITPLPFVGSKYSDGQIMGFAVVLPKDVTEGDRRAVLRAVGRWEASVRDATSLEDETPVLRLLAGRAGAMSIRRIAFGVPSQVTLREEAWTRPSRRWASATPVALDRNPGNLNDRALHRRAKAYDRAAAAVREACTRIGLPDPIEVVVTRSAMLPGSEQPARFGPFPADPDRTRRVLVHAALTFSEPVAGPVLIGAGRYVGLGLCRPLGNAGGHA